MEVTTTWINPNAVPLTQGRFNDNGTFWAANAGQYGYNKASVNVKEDRVIGKDPDTDEDKVVQEDPQDPGSGGGGGGGGDGDDKPPRLVETVLPSQIAVTVMPKRLRYMPGDIIDYAGLEVQARLKSGAAWDKSKGGFPGGMIPFKELILPVKQLAGPGNRGENDYPEDEQGPGTPGEGAIFPPYQSGPFRVYSYGKLGGMLDYIYGLIQANNDLDVIDPLGLIYPAIQELKNIPPPFPGLTEFACTILANVEVDLNETVPYHTWAGWQVLQMFVTDIPWDPSVTELEGEIYYLSCGGWWEYDPSWDPESGEERRRWPTIREATVTHRRSYTMSVPYMGSFFREPDTWGISNVNAYFTSSESEEGDDPEHVTGTFDVPIYTAASDLDCGIEQPIRFSTRGKAGGDLGGGSHIEYRFEGARVALTTDWNSIGYVLALPRQGTATITELEIADADGSVISRQTQTVNVYGQYRRADDGRVACYAVGRIDALCTIEYYAPDTGGDISAFLSHAGPIAWTMLYGTMNEIPTALPVQWARPGDGKVLETSFEVTVGMPVE